METLWPSDYIATVALEVLHACMCSESGDLHLNLCMTPSIVRGSFGDPKDKEHFYQIEPLNNNDTMVSLYYSTGAARCE